MTYMNPVDLTQEPASLRCAPVGVPPAVLKVMREAKHPLLIAHVPVDGDTLGSALGLGRVLQAIGKKVTVCVDDQIPGRLRQLPLPHEISRASEITPGRFDVAILLDVSDHDRIGGASAFLSDVSRVVIIDHHRVQPTRNHFPMLSKRAELLTWIDAEQDATAVLVTALATQLLDLAPMTRSTLCHVSFPLLAAILTDTGAFTQPGCTPCAHRVFKQLLRHHSPKDIESLVRILAYEPPNPAKALLTGRTRHEGPNRERRFDDRDLFDTLASGAQLVQQDRPVPFIACPRRIFELALSAAIDVSPETNALDIRGFLMERLDQTVLRNPVALLFLEAEGQIQISIRSKDPEIALSLARQLGGNGHGRKAAARLRGSLEETVFKVVNLASSLLRPEPAFDPMHLHPSPHRSHFGSFLGATP